MESNGNQPNSNNMETEDDQIEYQFWDFIARLLVTRDGSRNIPDSLMEIKSSLDSIKTSIDVNTKCQLQLMEFLKKNSQQN